MVTVNIKMTMIRFTTFCLIILLMISCSEKRQNKSGAFDPKAIALNKRAVKMISESKFDSAFILLDEAIKIDETYSVPHSNKATIYVNQINYRMALKENLLAVEKKPDLAEGWFMAGMLSDKTGDTIKSRDYYQRSIDLFEKKIADPEQKGKLMTFRLNRALALILLGKEAEGREEMRKLKEENPTDFVVNEFSKIEKKDFVSKFFY